MWVAGGGGGYFGRRVDGWVAAFVMRRGGEAFGRMVVVWWLIFCYGLGGMMCQTFLGILCSFLCPGKAQFLNTLLIE